MASAHSIENLIVLGMFTDDCASWQNHRLVAEADVPPNCSSQHVRIEPASPQQTKGTIPESYQIAKSNYVEMTTGIHKIR